MKLWPTVQAFLAVVSALAFAPVSFGASLDEDPTAVSLPLEIEINGKSKGEVVVRSTPSLDVVEIQGSSLKDLLRETVTEELAALVESLPETYFDLEHYRELGIEIDLDLERLVIIISIQEKVDPLSLVPNSIHLGYQRKLHYDTHVEEAGLSGYANLRWSTQVSRSESGSERTSNSLNISHVLNLSGYALEGESAWNQQAGLRLRQIRLVHDIPERLWRTSIGDISTPISDLQRGHQLFGANLVKEFGIQPYRTFTPTGSASFDLSEASTVKVSVNGRLSKTLRLDPGQYTIEEFKLAAGQNNMELEIQTESGQVDTLNVSEFGSTSLLGSGVSTYALSFGWPRSSEGTVDAMTISNQSWYKRYVDKNPIYSGYYRWGLHNRLTLNGNVQGSANWNRTGFGFNAAGERIGSLDGSFSYNQSSGNPAGFSSRIQWSRQIAAFNIAASTTYTERGFGLTEEDQPFPENDTKTSNSIGISRLFRDKINVSIKGFKKISHNGDSSQSATANIGRRFGAYYVNGSLRYSEDARGEKYGAFLNITWNPTRQWRAQSRASFDSSQGGMEISTRLGYSGRFRNAYTNGNLNLKDGPQGKAFDGSYSLDTSYFSTSIAHQEVYNSIDDYMIRGSDTSVDFETAIAFADGSFGIARQVRDSFAIVDQHTAWSDVKLGINPTLGGYEKLGKKSPLSPVLSDLRSYREGYATIQTVDSDMFLERNDFYFFPSYRRGSKLVIGNDAIYNIRSKLFYSDNSPVPYKAVSLTSEKGETINTFTNKVGRFMATELKPGRYTIEVQGSDEKTEILIVEGDIMIFIEAIVLERR